MRAPLPLVGLVALVLVASVSGCTNREPRQVTKPRPTITATATPAANGVPHVTIVGDASFHFTPSVIRAKPGKLTITLRTSGGTPHDLEVDGIGKQTTLVSQGGDASITVDLPKPGKYPFECTLHNKLGMTGTILVS